MKRSTLFDIAMAGIGLASMALLGVAGAMVSVSEAYPQELAATAPIPQPKPPVQPETIQVPVNLTCMDFGVLEKELHKLGRFQIGGGIAAKDVVTLIYSTPDGREWTFITLNSDDVACIVLNGNYWRNLPVEKRSA